MTTALQRARFVTFVGQEMFDRRQQEGSKSAAFLFNVVQKPF